MRKIFLLFAIAGILASCSSSEDEKPMDKKTGIILRVKAENRLNTGEIKIEETTGNIVRVWKSDGREFDAFSHPIEDTKYLYDQKSKQSFEYDHMLSGGTMSKELPAGRYYFFVQTSTDGRFNRTGGNINITEGNDMPVYEILVKANNLSYSWFEWSPTLKQ